MPGHGRFIYPLATCMKPLCVTCTQMGMTYGFLPSGFEQGDRWGSAEHFFLASIDQIRKRAGIVKGPALVAPNSGKIES